MVKLTKPEDEIKENKLGNTPNDAVSLFSYFSDQFGNPCAFIETENVRRIYPVKSRDYRNALLNMCRKLGISKINSNLLTDLKILAEAHAASDESRNGRKPLYVRAARYEGALWFDLTDQKWRAVKITPGKWEIVDKPPILFKRFQHQRALAVADKGTRADYEKFLSLINFATPEDRLLTAIWLPTCIVSGIPHALDVITGPQGSAKSSAQEALRIIVDDSVVRLLSMPRDQKEFAQQLSHHYMPAYDNCHELSQAQSDMLCRSITGEGFSKRSLYTDDDDQIYEYQRCIAINGIGLPSVAPDLLDRAIHIKLTRIPKNQRRLLEDIRKEINDIAPKVRAYLFEVVSNAYAIIETLPKTNYPRMADWARWGEAISRAMGNKPNEFVTAYDRNIQDSTSTAVAENLLGDLILNLADESATDSVFDGTATELFKKLLNLAKDRQIDTKYNKDWPQAPQSLTRKLGNLVSPLEDSGIKLVLNGRKGKKRNIYIWKIPSASSEVSALEVKKTDAIPTADAIDTVGKGLLKSSDAIDIVGKTDTVGKTLELKYDIDASDGIIRKSENAETGVREVLTDSSSGCLSSSGGIGIGETIGQVFTEQPTAGRVSPSPTPSLSSLSYTAKDQSALTK